ncbi:HET domain containing protein [Hyaloscypha variabilis]
MAISHQEPYEHIPITEPDGIRLIVLQPSSERAAAVHCSIIHTTLRRAREEIFEHYTTLSYVWGDANDTTFISVDGRRLKVTKNLECALRYLRDEKRVLHVWADGVCINQQDNDEKGKQVKQMGQVYEIAHHTVIFLGECDAATEAVLIEMLAHHENAVMYPRTDEGVNLLRQVLARPWFYRIWILQELVMSHDPRLQLGSIRFPWRTLYRLKALFPNQEARYKASNDLGPKVCFSHPTQAILGGVSTSLMGAFEVVNQMNKAKSIFEKSQVDSRYNTEEKAGKSTVDTVMYPEIEDPLLSVMEARRACLASDSRDRVFAHLGLAEHLNLTPDYRITSQQVFEAFAERHISTTNSLDIFSYVEDIELDQRMQGLPTWAPDWTRRQENPRYRVCTLQAIAHWYSTEVTYGKVKRGPNSSFGAHNFQAGCFTSKAFCMGSIAKLSRVLDTTSYKMIAEDDSWLQLQYAHKWVENQSGFDNVKLDLLRSSRRLGTFGDFSARELRSAKDKDGCLLDGRRLAILERKPSNNRNASVALVPASSKEGDLIYYPQWSTLSHVLRPVGTPYGYPPKENKVVHMIGVCFSEALFTNAEDIRPWVNDELEKEKSEYAEFITIY